MGHRVQAAVGPRCRRGELVRRRTQDLRGPDRSRQAGLLQHQPRIRVRSPRRQQRECRRRIPRARPGAVRHSRRGLGRDDRRHRQHRGRRPRGDTRLHSQPGSDRARAAGPTGRRHSRRPRRGRDGRGDDAHGRERPRRRRPRQSGTRGHQGEPPGRRHRRDVLRPHGPRPEDDWHRHQESGRGGHPRRGRAAFDARQCPRRSDRRLSHSVVDARGVHRDGVGRALWQFDEPWRHRLRTHRRWLGCDDREHRTPARRSPGAGAVERRRDSRRRT